MSSEEEVHTWIRLESTSLLCAAPLSSEVELIFCFLFFFILKYLLVDLIPRFTTWTISHPPHPHDPSHFANETSWSKED